MKPMAVHPGAQRQYDLLLASAGYSVAQRYLQVYLESLSKPDKCNPRVDQKIKKDPNGKRKRRKKNQNPEED